MIDRPGTHLQHPPQHSLLGRFVLLAVLAHAPLLMHWATEQDSLYTPLAVVLQQRPPAATPSDSATVAATPPRPQAVRSAPTRPAHATASVATKTAAAETASSPATAPAQVHPAPLPVAASVTDDSGSADGAGQARDAIVARIEQELARHFRYPPLAVRRGWHGTVLLALHVTCDGAIEAIQVAQSSGHALLDDAALSALQQIPRIALDGGPLRTALDLQLPVIYRLEES